MTMSMNNAPLDWSPPNGYPDVAGAWRSCSNLLLQWQYHRGLAQNWFTDSFVVPPVIGLYGSVAPATSGQAIAVLLQRLVGEQATPAIQDALQVFLNEPASTPLGRSNLQWYLEHLVPLILDSQHHALG